MANYIRPDSPVFIEEIRKIDATNRAHADILNRTLEPLYQNGIALKVEMEHTNSQIAKVLENKLFEFKSIETVFNSDGSITETGASGSRVTVFNMDGSITETYTGKDGARLRKKIVFHQNSIVEKAGEVND